MVLFYGLPGDAPLKPGSILRLTTVGNLKFKRVYLYNHSIGRSTIVIPS
jgi:hypothetical protein